MAELLQSHDETNMTNYMDEQRKWFPEMESTPGKDAVKIVEMTTKDLEYYVNLVDKAGAGFGRIDSNFAKSSVLRCCQTALHATEKSFVKGRVIRCSKLHCCLKLPQHHQPSAPITLTRQQPSAWTQDPPPTK